MKKKLDHPILRMLIKVFAPEYNSHLNPCKKAERQAQTTTILPPINITFLPEDVKRVQKIKDYELDEKWIEANHERQSEPDI